MSVEVRAYNRSECISFRKTNGTFGGLSNMAPGFPLKVNGVLIRTSEALYQACRFPHLPDVQRMIIEEGSPMTAKMKSKPFRSQSRPDWDLVRVKIMRWCLRVKLVQNWEQFSQLLLSTGDQPIVEDSRKDDFWGAKSQDNGKLVGRNVLGRLLMELRKQLRDPASSSGLKRVSPPLIPTFLLYQQPISVIGTDVSSTDSEFGSNSWLVTQERANKPLMKEVTSMPISPPGIGDEASGISATGTGAATPATLSADGISTLRGEPDSPLDAKIRGLLWTGEVAPQKWMSFYKEILSRFTPSGGLKLTVSIEVEPPGGTTTSKVEEMKGALRELGMPEDVKIKTRGSD